MLRSSEKFAVIFFLAGSLLVMASFMGIETSTYLMNLIGQIAAFSLLALSLDLIWGFCGILSLGHGLYFAIGGYLVAMHLVKVAFEKTGTPPDFMLFMGWEELPAYYFGIESFAYLLFVVFVVTLSVSLIFGYFSFRSRVTGVYFAIITQALVYMAMLFMFRNDTGFGGNNGMTGFSEIFGLNFRENKTATVLCGISLAVLGLSLLGCKKLVDAPLGRFMRAVKEDESRLRFLGFDTVYVKLTAWCISAILAAIAGLLYVPQVGIINPRVLSPELSIEIAVWVAIGGRGSLIGAIFGAVVVSGLKFILTGLVPELWPFILAILVVGIVIYLPNGFSDGVKVFSSNARSLVSAPHRKLQS